MIASMSKKNYKLTCLSIENRAREQGYTPSRLKLLNWGNNPSTRGLVVLNEKTATLLPRMQKELGYDRIALDFEHNTVPGTDAYESSQEPRSVAAHGVPLLILNDGLYITDLVWTDDGKKSSQNYPDLSPCVARDKDGSVLWIHSAGLVRTGSVTGLEFFSVDVPINNNKETGMKEAWMFALLGLEEGATEDQINARAGEVGSALTALSAVKPETLKELIALSVDDVKKIIGIDADMIVALSAVDTDGIKSKLELLDNVSSGAKSTIEALSARLATAESTLETFSADYVQSQRDSIIDAARREGKVIPLSAEQIADTDVTVLADMVGRLPATVPVDQRTPETFAVDSKSSTVVDGGSAGVIAGKFGHTEAELKEAGL